jgi:hypothetical protein
MSSRTLLLTLAATVVGACSPLTAATVNIDLSSATTGTSITAPGGSFAQIFAGQSVAGTGITGSPSAPLTLKPAGTLEVENWDPGVSPVSNSILSQPGNQGPLSILLASNANSLAFTSGAADGGDAISLDFFDSNGNLVDTLSKTLTADYAVYSFTSLPVFRGVTVFNDNDSNGLRFQNISYTTATATPEPSLLPVAGLLLVGLSLIRRRTVRP